MRRIGLAGSVAFAVGLACCGGRAPAPARVALSAPSAAPLAAGRCAHVEIATPDPPYSSAYAHEDGAADACGVTTKNLDDTEGKLLASLGAHGAAPPFAPWDHTRAI